MTKPEDFQAERLEWSRWKHEILEGYLKQMTGRLQRHSTVYFVDGFAGPGRYLEDGAEGSPLLAARLAEQLDRDRWYSLRCINVEQDRQVFANLQTATIDFTPKFVTNFYGAFANHISAILEQTEEQPALFFLDPIGLKGLEWDTLTPLFDRGYTFGSTGEITELLIRFDTIRAIRDLGYEHSEWEQADTHFRRLLDVLGLSEVQVLHEQLDKCNEDDTNCRKKAIIQVYKAQLQKYFQYVLQIPIRSQSDQLKYYLIFATRHVSGVAAMNETLHLVEDIREKSRPHQMYMFAPSEEQVLLEELNDLKRIILRVLEPHERTRMQELKAKVALWGDNLGRYSNAHFTAVFEKGRPRKIKRPKGFRPIEENIIQLEGTPSKDNAIVIKQIKD